jgi:CRISPR type III-associated protein (TIGR04423 family)
MMKKTREEIVEYINSLDGYEGYVQFSDRPIEDIWTQRSNISVDPKEGFVYEAHFCNGTESIAIKQVNGEWLVSTTQISEIDNEETDIETYYAHEKNVKMAQIWQEETDEVCEGMKVKKLQKVVFAGFAGGES